MVGVTPEMLTERGYAVVDVPSAEDQINACIPLTGDERVQCWADLDTYLMEEVVPWVPYLFDNDVVVLSANVTSYSFDQFAGLPALDRIAVEAGASVGREGVAPLRGATPTPATACLAGSRKLWQGAERHEGRAGVGIGGRGRRVRRYPPAGIQVPAAATGKARDAAGQEPHLSRRDPGPSVLSAAYRLIRLFGWCTRGSVIEPKRNASCSQSLRRR